MCVCGNYYGAWMRKPWSQISDEEVKKRCFYNQPTNKEVTPKSKKDHTFTTSLLHFNIL